MPFVARDPGIDGDVGDRILVGEALVLGEMAVHHAVQPLRFLAVAFAAVRDLVLLRAHEVVRLAEHRPDAAHLEHEPLQRDVLVTYRARQKFAGLAGEVNEDRARLHHGDRLAVRAVRIDDGWDLAVRVDLQIVGGELLAVRADVDLVHVIGEAALLEHDGDLAAVGRAPGIEFDHGEVARDGVLGAGDSIGGDAALAAVSRRATAGRFSDPGARTRVLHPVRHHRRAVTAYLGDQPPAVGARRSRVRPTFAAARA